MRLAFTRAAGLLLHPTSLPGRGGIGTIGRAAYDFIDAAADAGMQFWQVLPLGPTGYADSPYAGLSAFAGNPHLIALERLAEEGLLEWPELAKLPAGGDARVDFGVVGPAMQAILRLAHARWKGTHREDASFERFCRENHAWLEDFALYMALKNAHGGSAWSDWERPLRQRSPAALSRAQRIYSEDIEFHCFVQHLFFQQWERLRRYAQPQGLRIIGDMPIFVAHDSADVWAHQELFRLDRDGKPEVVAGVPPDYFSETGQLWGNPVYRWDVMERDGFAWWIERFRILRHLVDIVRIDHFRGFAAAWNVPFGEATAEHGEWVPSPGNELFTAVIAALGPVPIIAENLGVITPDVTQLQQRFGFPGMEVLQFAFGSGADNASLPHNFDHNTAVYTGTHDNDTTVGWFLGLDPPTRAEVLRYLGTDGIDISWDMIRLALASVADLAILPMQDILRLGSGARMNYPGKPEGNWTWRMLPGAFEEVHRHNLRSLLETFGR